MGILFTILLGIPFTITMGFLFTITLGIQFTVSNKLGSYRSVMIISQFESAMELS